MDIFRWVKTNASLKTRSHEYIGNNQSSIYTIWDTKHFMNFGVPYSHLVDSPYCS